MGTDWIECLDKRPTDRTGHDLDLIFSKLKGIKAFESFQPMLLQQICYYGYYENLDKGVTLFRHGDVGTNWYVCLSGSVDVVLPTDNSKVQNHVCTLGSGTAFGESILYDTPRNATIVTSDICELLRVEQNDFKILWAKNREYMQGVITSLSKLTINPDPKRRLSEFDPSLIPLNLGSRLEWKNDPCRNPALPIVSFPSLRIANSANVLKACILSTAPQMIRDRKYHLQTHKSCLVGSEMVDWLIHLSPIVHSRSLAVGMWQALLEEGTIEHVNREHYFKDKYLFYRFTIKDKNCVELKNDKKTWEDQLQETIILLTQIAPDATLRMILRKPPHERTSNDLDIIYEELIHVKALSHLSSLVKKELASVLLFEAHPYQNTIIFNQGDEGESWYIILKGSVDVSIQGKGIVSTLSEGDDFGKLSLVNKTPRSASIITKENNCHFLRVDKDDFNRILKDVEANTVRLKEHDKDVLILEKIPFNTKNEVDGTSQACYKYSVTIGAPEKILEHLLETRILCKDNDTNDTFVEDFLMTYIVFLPANKLCPMLTSYYKMLDDNKSYNLENSMNNKRRIVSFLKEWCDIAKDAFYEDFTIMQLLQEILNSLRIEAKINSSLKEELKTVEAIIESDPYSDSKENKKVKFLWRKGSRDVAEKLRKPIRPKDENIFKVYCADHTYTTLKLNMDSPASKIIALAAEKLSLNDNNLVLCEVRSNGEKTLFKENDVSITTSLSINGRLFLSPSEHLDALTPLPEQEGPNKGTWQLLEMFGSKELAYVLTLHDWELFNAVHPYELIYQVFGRHKFNKITANLDLFMRRFNEVQYWVCTELCLCNNLGKRVTLLRKFIKLAQHCKAYQNLNSFFAIIMGLSNVAISRLSLTWEKLPSRFKKMFSDFESAMDPSRNHRRYRLLVEQLQPPIIPFMPLLLKDMTFTHEGNKTFFNGLVNFEKMRLLSNTIRTMRKCRSAQLEIPIPHNIKYFQEIKDYIQNLKVIDNQRTLTHLSSVLEPRKA